MVRIRLARAGSKKRPFYHVVAADQRAPRDGKFIENLGYYNPLAKGKSLFLKLNREKINYWIGNGAQPSDRVNSLIKEFDKIGENIFAKNDSIATIIESDRVEKKPVDTE